MPKIQQLIKKFNFKKKFNGKDYDQIAHVKTKREALKFKKQANNEGYHATVKYHPLKKDKHYDTYVRKK